MAEDNKIQTVKRAPPPADLPMLGKVDPREISFIGRTNYVAALEEKKFIFGIKRADRRRHLYIIGKSGVGKSKLLELLVRQDIAYGKGLCFIDPHGDVIEEILHFIPENRIEDVYLIDVFDLEKSDPPNLLANFDLGKLMGENKIILINLAKNKISEENFNFLGIALINKIKQAGIDRARMPESSRQDFYLYMDEFQNLVSGAFESLLSEAGKYGLSVTLAHQYMGQLSSGVRATVLGNVGSIVVFRVGGEDAQILESELAPIFKIKDMINLGTQEFYIKLMIDGEVYDPFSAETLKVLSPNHLSYKDKIIDASRLKNQLS